MTNRRNHSDLDVLTDLSTSSFRDPHSRVTAAAGEITRTFSAHAGSKALEFMDSNAYRKITRRGDLHEPLWSETTDDGEVTFGHAVIPNWNYPWEWTWSMLRDAALVHVELLLICAHEGWTLSDATSFNIVFTNGQPVFIDHGSFVRRDDNEPWWAYADFCEHFLYPLMVTSYTNARLAPLLRGGFGRVSLNDAHAILRSHKRKKGVLKYVLLPHLAATKSDLSVGEVSESTSDMTTEIFVNVLNGIRKLILGLEAPGGVSTWSEYNQRSHYSKATLDEKGTFVDEVLAECQPSTVLDMGANDGYFSTIAAKHAESVVAADGDPLVIDRFYVSKPSSNILPLLQDATNPSPSMGWRSQERTGFLHRIQPDLVMALAVFHHISLTGNVPLTQLSHWMAEVDADFLVEFVHRDDEKVQHLLSRKTDPDSFDYSLENFLQTTGSFFRIVRQEMLSNGTRTMLHLTRK